MSTTARFRRTIRKLRYSVVPGAGGPPTPVDVVWIYRLLLDRSPENRAIAEDQALRHSSIESLCFSIVSSPEYQAKLKSNRTSRSVTMLPVDAASATDHDVIRSFGEYTGPGTPGYVTDYLGTKTRIGFIKGLESLDARVEGFPIPGNFHASANEWAGTLRAVLEADGEFVCLELGAGWGPWLTTCAAACRMRGIDRVKLIGVEAAASHVEFMRQHFLDNGLDPEYHTLLHGAAAAEDGFAEFPELDDPANDYGATLSVDDPLLNRVIGRASRVKAYSIPTLLDEYKTVNLVHIDIQGSESDVVGAARSTLKAKVKRLVIGTHGRAVEQWLLEDLSADGWICETDDPCRYKAFADGLTLAVDGCQVWRNPEL